MRRNDHGFTLVEVLVATVLSALVGAAVTKSMIFTTNVVGENTMAAEAIAVAQEALEDLRTVPYEEIHSSTKTSLDGLFTIACEVQNDSPDHEMKAIGVTVTWLWKGKPRTYALHTVYSKINKT
jgi:prepilin-type N-terminal cleavage/methylation domain-containing protein